MRSPCHRIDRLERGILAAAGNPTEEHELLSVVRRSMRLLRHDYVHGLWAGWGARPVAHDDSVRSDPAFLDPCAFVPADQVDERSLHARNVAWRRLERMSLRLMSRRDPRKRDAMGEVLASPRWAQTRGAIRTWLGRELLPTDGAWPDEIELAEERLGYRLPVVLRELYLLFARLDVTLGENDALTPLDFAVHGKFPFWFASSYKGGSYLGVSARDADQGDPPYLFTAYRSARPPELVFREYGCVFRAVGDTIGGLFAAHVLGMRIVDSCFVEPPPFVASDDDIPF